MRKRPESWDDLINEAENPRYRWPKKGDRLLPRSDDWHHGVQFSKHPISRHVHIWDGFMSAADGLIELCTQDGYEHERNFVIYPILFNYRHGLELAMKWIILHYGLEDAPVIIEGHNLWKLWTCCRAIVERYEPEDDEAIGAVEQIVKDFHDLDQAGITFRYGWGKDGKEIKLPDHVFDLENVRDVMKGVANYFNGLDGWLDDLQSAAP